MVRLTAATRDFPLLKSLHTGCGIHPAYYSERPESLIFQTNKYTKYIYSIEYIILIINITYLLIPWSRVLVEKLIGSAASQEIPGIFGTRRFITVLTSARHLSLS